MMNPFGSFQEKKIGKNGSTQPVNFINLRGTTIFLTVHVCFQVFSLSLVCM